MDKDCSDGSALCSDGVTWMGGIGSDGSLIALRYQVPLCLLMRRKALSIEVSLGCERVWRSGWRLKASLYINDCVSSESA